MYDDKGKLITFFESLQFGLGFFSLRPQPGRHYRVEATFEEHSRSFSVPAALPQGYGLRLDYRGESLTLRVATNIPGGLDGAFILGQMRGVLFCTAQPDPGVDQFIAKVPLDNLPDGVGQVTLFTSSGEPVCERLVFLRQPANQAALLLTTDRESYGKRAPVTLDLHLTDAAGKPLQANLSASVTDQFVVSRPDGIQDIRSYLLLNSDLRGYIENPGYYFEDDTPGRRRLLDLLMLTHGWRRFVWRDLLADRFPDIRYSLENGFSVRGVVTRLDRPDDPVAADVFISALTNTLISRF